SKTRSFWADVFICVCRTSTQPVSFCEFGGPDAVCDRSIRLSIATDALAAGIDVAAAALAELDPVRARTSAGPRPARSAASADAPTSCGLEIDMRLLPLRVDDFRLGTRASGRAQARLDATSLYVSCPRFPFLPDETTPPAPPTLTPFAGRYKRE